MNTNPPLYVSYSDLPGAAPLIQLLEKDAYDLILMGAGAMGHFATRIHVRSPRADDRPLEIVAVTDARFDKERAERIQQAVINWLMEMQVIPMRTGDEESQAE